MNTNFLKTAEPLKWAKATRDLWLVNVVKERLQASQDDLAWATAVTAGWTAIHAQSPNPTDIMNRVLRGEIVEELIYARRWVCEMTSTQRDLLEAEAIHRATDFLDMVGRLDTPERVKAFCLQRDDLEGIHILLQGADCGESLGTCLDVLDRMAEEKVEGLTFKIEDERLYRAWLVLRWWGRFSGVDEPNPGC